VTNQGLSNADFARLRDFIYGECGIKVTEAKRPMLEARLQKRLRSLGIESYGDYCEYLFSSKGMEEELVFMIDSITTNKTDFFREPGHFQFLTDHVIPELIRLRGAGTGRRLAVWSAGCSSGEEPYTLAMVLKEYGGQSPDGGLDFLVWATDISTSVLGKAARAVYDEERISPIPSPFKQKYLLRSKDKDRRVVRIAPEIRSLVKFRRVNFMDEDFGFREPLDVIFCRNVIIYFDKITQQQLLGRFCRYLAPGGYIFMGHSETLFGMDVPLYLVAPTVYRKM
jgi:chemotaxis protein methyltransferase CheR